MKLRQHDTGEFAYGNTRLRARKAALLGPADYETLIGLDLDGLLAALTATAHRPDVEAALPRFHGVRRLHEAVRTNLARSLRELRGFYSGAARELIETMLSWWDVRNLLTVLRGQAGNVPAEEVVGLIVPVGHLDEASAHEVARQREFAAAVELLLAWRLPTPEDATALADAWPDYERSADLAALEHTIVSAHVARAMAVLESWGEEAEPLRAALREEVEDRNLLIALRLRGATLDRSESVAGEVPVVPGSPLSAETLADAAGGGTRDDVAARVLVRPGTDRWRRPLDHWARTGDIVNLQDELERARVRERIGLFAKGDPLGIAIPLAFATAKETEARNLRVLAAGAVEAADIHVIRARLVTS